MEHTSYAGIGRQPEASVSLPVLPPHLRLLFLVIGSFTVTMLAVIALAGLTPAPVDPFAPYSDIMPGKSLSALIEHGFSCELVFPLRPEDYCEFGPAQGPFSQISVITSQSTVTSIGFTVRDNALRVGDLPQKWGRPSAQVAGEYILLYWPGHNMRVGAHSAEGKFSWLLPLHSIDFFDSPVVGVLR